MATHVLPVKGASCWGAGAAGELVLQWPGQVGKGLPATNLLVHSLDGSLKWLAMEPVPGLEVRSVTLCSWFISLACLALPLAQPGWRLLKQDALLWPWTCR